ncbi:hypothetical protein ACFQS1_19880 [Paractinoplanes rhizophilus]|uniref:Uncharacterized protein n=1 Tax=Paractinoplanes rhizophilus TaxID=1416877 RepID=A0ABW2HTW2_9ACTN
MASDVLDRTARQVYIPGHAGYIHRLATAKTSSRLGRVYTSDCDRTYYGMDGAVLTTAAVTCPHCGGA